ncbi:sulfurtransferase [Comamonas endophytica]|uniref:Rhodanese-like domain-containing protein n=1 Tax=Comamonas endophytica TaxID=2949090 RepID=A0ABY6GA14_9BURK|nr:MULTISPECIES: rhodanese-like domain-containing protein [unclassified Acidovorax]MCD2514028.1 sulfurtransferase [Acidovorax sp. D4N7]UYG51175.1 rhodanese-like domain-containing protein [Acidovorax sp. 5MLIR]
MKKMLAFAVALTAAQWVAAAQPLLTPAQLNAIQATSPALRVIDIRDAKAYGAQHIPGALNAPYAKWRGPATNPGELPDVSKLTQLVQSLGLTPSTHAVVVSTGADATDFGASARVYWTLKTLGLKELSIVNGGMKSWADAKLPQDSATPEVAASRWQPQLDSSLIATREDIRRNIDLSNAALVDSRPDAFYQGKTRAPAAKLSGTLPGAQQLDFNQWFVPGTSTFVDAAAARQIAAKVQRQQGQDMVAFCNTGHWAATDWFGLSEMAGLPNVKLYAGSMVDWTQQPDAPALENQPSRAESLAYDARQWWQRKFK